MPYPHNRLSPEIAKARRYKRTKAWFAENKARRALYNKRYYAANAEKLRANAKADRAAHPEKVRAWNEAYARKYPGRHRDCRQRRKLRLAWRAWSVTCAKSREARAYVARCC